MNAGAANGCISNAWLALPGCRGALPRGDVLVEEGRIVAVAVSADDRRAARERSASVVDASGQILMPGLVNAHYHSYACALRGTCNDLPLELWALYTVAHGSALGDEAIRLAVLLGAAEMIRGGVTACIDHFPHLRRAECALRAHEESGMRVGFAPMLQDVQDWQYFGLDLPPPLRAALEAMTPLSPDELAALFADLHARWHGRGGRLSLLLGPNAPQRCSAALRAMWRRINDELAPQVHTHLLETRAQAQRAKRVNSAGLVAELAREGLLNDRLSVAHGIWTSETDRQLLVDNGVVVVHNPVSNCMLGSGAMPLVDYLERGAAVALGSDSSNSGGRHDLFEVMRFALALPRLGTTEHTRWPRPGAVWRCATEGGARALGLQRQLGSIARGQFADLVLLRHESASLVAHEASLQTLVHHGGAESVAAVMIHGTWVYRDGELLAFDERRAVDRFRSLAREIAAAAAPGIRLADELRPHFERLFSRPASGASLAARHRPE